MDVLIDLNERQKEAVLTTEGPVLILAGAGSGKTRALTHRVAYLICAKRVHPENILAVTFTNKAANVMKERVAKLLSLGSKLKARLPARQAQSSKLVSLPWLGTFHAVCVKILRREGRYLGYPSSFTIYDEQDALRAVKQVMRDLSIPEKKYNPRAVRAYISQAKGELISAKQYQAFAFEHFQEVVAKVFPQYEKALRAAAAFDFDDLIMRTVELFQKEPSVLEKYQRRFRYILVDEYQDTNHAQYVFLKLLASASRNIFAIGDDWQSIYSFRGAKFQNILDFKKDYPEAKVILLEENYRSTAPILNAAQAVIKNNELRSDKNLFTTHAKGAPVVVAGAQEKPNEVEFILDEIGSVRVGERMKLRDFVILYRTNAQSRLFEETLMHRGIPYRIIGGVRFYTRREIKDVLAYLTLLHNPNDRVALSRVVNVPPRGIGEKTMEKILALGEKAAQELPKYQQFLVLLDSLRDFAARIPPARGRGLAAGGPAELIDKVVHLSGYRDFLSDGSPESEERLENIEELRRAAAEYDSLTDFLAAVALVADIDEYREREDVLTLMTVHSAKGLEFPVVFITGLEEGLFPHANSLNDQGELEEERRLMYVGMTRARERLYLSWSKMRFGWGAIQPSWPSRFLDELPQDEIETIEI